MNDLELDEITHDLVIENGDLKLLNSEAQVSKQSLKINLLFFKGEWFLDLEYGIPYFQSILKKRTTKNVADALIKLAIRNSYRIESVEEFESEITNSQYIISKFVARTTDGEIISITNLKII